MANNRNSSTKAIIDLLGLTFVARSSDAEQSYPIMELSINYEVDNFPRAEVTLSTASRLSGYGPTVNDAAEDLLGRGLAKSGKIVLSYRMRTFDGSDDSAEVKTITLFAGHLASVTDGIQGNRLSIEGKMAVALTSDLEALGTTPASSYTYYIPDGTTSEAYLGISGDYLVKLSSYQDMNGPLNKIRDILQEFPADPADVLLRVFKYRLDTTKHTANDKEPSSVETDGTLLSSAVSDNYGLTFTYDDKLILDTLIQPLIDQIVSQPAPLVLKALMEAFFLRMVPTPDGRIHFRPLNAWATYDAKTGGYINKQSILGISTASSPAPGVAVDYWIVYNPDQQNQRYVYAPLVDSTQGKNGVLLLPEEFDKHMQDLWKTNPLLVASASPLPLWLVHAALKVTNRTSTGSNTGNNNKSGEATSNGSKDGANDNSNTLPGAALLKMYAQKFGNAKNVKIPNTPKGSELKLHEPTLEDICKKMAMLSYLENARSGTRISVSVPFSMYLANMYALGTVMKIAIPEKEYDIDQPKNENVFYGMLHGISLFISTDIHGSGLTVSSSFTLSSVRDEADQARFAIDDLGIYVYKSKQEVLKKAYGDNQDAKKQADEVEELGDSGVTDGDPTDWDEFNANLGNEPENDGENGDGGEDENELNANSGYTYTPQTATDDSKDEAGEDRYQPWDG